MQQRSAGRRSTVDSRRRLTIFKMLVSRSMPVANSNSISSAEGTA